MYYSWLVGYRVDQTESCQACFHPRGVTPNLGKTQFSAVEGFPLSPHLHQCLRILESWLDEAEVFPNHDSDIFGVVLMLNQKPIMHTLTKDLEVLISLRILETHRYSL